MNKFECSFDAIGTLNFDIEFEEFPEFSDIEEAEAAEEKLFYKVSGKDENNSN